MPSSGPNAETDSRRAGKPKPGRSAARAGTGKKPRPTWWRVLRVLLILGVVGAVLGMGGLAGIFIYYGRDPNLPTLRALGDYHPKQVVRVVDRSGAVIGEIGEKRTVVPFSAIPKVLVQAVISAEDAAFYQHGGIDYRGMLRAFIENVVRRRTAQGGSTITQQVVKTFLLSPERTLRRKVQEIILARRLTEQLSKDEVLTLYLNQINFGQGHYGCEEAARYYFGKSVRDINTAEAALLAGLPQGPERLSPRRHPDAAKNRQRYVLGQMAEHGYITRQEAEKLAAEPIRLSREVGPTVAAPEAMDYVGHVLAEDGRAKAAENGGIIETTIDAKLQLVAREALERGLEDLDARQGYRGRSGHLQGRALEKHRTQLTAAREERQKKGWALGIVDGVVEKVEADPQNPGGGRLIVDIGGVRGAVDLTREPRYEKGPKPLVARFVPGDLVRVRLAPERGQGGELVSLALEIGPQAAMVVMDPQTHEVLALVGGYNYRAPGFDRSRDARRQPGSSFKPILYAAALDTGKYTAASIVNDAATPIPMPTGVTFKPQNHETDDYKGPVTLRFALAESINTVAVRVLADISIPTALDMARKVGLVLVPSGSGAVFTSPRGEARAMEMTQALSKVGPSLALGAVDVAPIDMVNAYAAFASGGKRGDWSIVKSVLGQAMAVKAPEQAVRPEVAYVITAMMKSVVQEGTARSAAARLRRPAAGKTGTSDISRDAWFIGYTPDLLAGVWVGFDDGKPLGRGEAGARSALPIWTSLMTKALANRPVRDFPQPPGVVVARIDKKTGLLALPGSDGLDEVFVNGTAPTEAAPAAGEEPSADKLLLEQ